MKFLTALFFSTFATLALACPDLSGEYQCYDEDYGYYTNTVSQTGSGAATVYTVTNYEGTDTATANNQWVNTVQSGQNIKTKASCQGDSLVLTMQFVDPAAGVVTANINMSLDASTDLVGQASLNVGGVSFPAEVSTCTRL